MIGHFGEMSQEGRTSVWSSRATIKFLRLAHLQRLKNCEQVAAVCYRVRDGEVEFLLVRTRGGRWTFPKGCAEPGLTHAQAAALEAFEEAGVHGRMEEASFASYTHRKRTSVGSKARVKDLVVTAYLCEVRRLETPSELNRRPTWFSAEKAKKQLRDGRKDDYGAEQARIVNRAAARIRKTHSEFMAVTAPPRPKVAFIDRARAIRLIEAPVGKSFKASFK